MLPKLTALEDIKRLLEEHDEAQDVTDSALKLAEFLGVSPALQVSPSNNHAYEAVSGRPHTSLVQLCLKYVHTCALVRRCMT